MNTMGEAVTPPGNRAQAANVGRADLEASDLNCYQKARVRGDDTFTLVEQDLSAPTVICEWIKQNIETCPAEKLRLALEHALEMRKGAARKHAD